ncbi:MAG: hypothetical protein PGN08_09110 [Sphingomonas taxi]
MSAAAAGSALPRPAPWTLGVRALALAVAGLLMLVAGLRAPLFTVLQAGQVKAIAALNAWMYYNVAFLSANFLDAGFVRRGLGGTIAALLSRDPDTGAFLFHLLSAGLLIAALLVLGWRLFRAASWPAAAFMLLFCVVSPQLFLGWGNDIARTDMAVIGCIAFAAIALDAGRPAMAAALLVFGFMVHETAIIFGLPLLFAVAVMRQGDGLRGARPLLPHALGLVAVIVGLVLVQGLVTPETDVFVRSMVDHTPAPESAWYRDLRDCAIYMMVTGLRGLKTAMCYNVYYDAYGFMVVFSVLVTLANGLALGLERRWGVFAVAILAPVLFMDLVANDIGRWVKFACASSWILSALLQERGVVRIGGMRLALGVLLLGGLLFMGSSRVHTVNRMSEALALRLGYPVAPEVGDWMTHCDPDWRSVVGMAPDAMAPAVPR